MLKSLWKNRITFHSTEKFYWMWIKIVCNSVEKWKTGGLGETRVDVGFDIFDDFSCFPVFFYQLFYFIQRVNDSGVVPAVLFTNIVQIYVGDVSD